MTLPGGTITFLFTDIEGSTKLWDARPEAMRLALARHDDLMRQAIENNRGVVFKTIGDAFCAAFTTASDALAAALQAQIQLNHREHGEHREETDKEIQRQSEPQIAQSNSNQATLNPQPSTISFLPDIPLRVRMALHTGTPELRNDDYFGQPLNRVARLLSAAWGGQVLLSDVTQGLTRNFLPPDATCEDLGLHPLKDLPEPARVWQLRHPALSSDSRPLRVPPTVVHGLPQTFTSFIGRAKEEGEAEALLRQPGIRLVTLTGFGGMGKSRLAMQVAARCMLAFPEGAWWIELETVRSTEGVWARMAERLGLTPQGGESAREQTCRVLREREALLVLDNTEQIEAAATVVRDLLAACPGIKCLVATRRALGIRGERILDLPPLTGLDAQTLFVERARDVKADFTLSDENRADVAELCRRLDGAPLALELAAARCALLTPHQILIRLNERFRLLQSRAPDLPPRQKALHAAIEWSYCLLAEEEQIVLGQLSVFEGGFTLEDAEAVCEAFDIFESVEILHSHSFFRVETEAGGQAHRFAMLESVREFAAEQLRETGQDARFAERHAQRFLQQATTRFERLRTADESASLRAMDADGDNLRAAARWAKAVGQIPLFPHLMLLLGRWRHRRGFLQEAVTRIQDGLDALRPHDGAYPVLFAELLRERAGLHLDFGENGAAHDCAEAARTLSVNRGDVLGEARAANLLGQAAMHQERWEEAREQYGSALHRFRNAGSDVETAIVLNNLGMVERRDKSGSAEERETRIGRAEQHYEEARRLRLACNDRRGLAETLNNLGVLAQERSDLERAERCYREALELEQQVRDSYIMALLFANLGEVALLRGKAANAVRHFAVSERLLEETQSPLRAMVVAMMQQAATSGQMPLNVLTALQYAVRALPADQLLRFGLTDPDPTADE